MSPQRSPNPRPRLREGKYTGFDFPIVSARRLAIPKNLPNKTFVAIANSRTSARDFKRALNDNELSKLLWISGRTIFSRKETNGFLWEHRPSPSAGGRHPIHVLLIERHKDGFELKLYIPRDHRLAKLNITGNALQSLLKRCDKILDTRSATLLVFAAEFARTTTKYDHAETLIWRDAGALMATTSFAAAALNFSSCLLGLTGEPFVSRALKSNRKIVGVGAIAVGV